MPQYPSIVGCAKGEEISMTSDNTRALTRGREVHLSIWVRVRARVRMRIRVQVRVGIRAGVQVLTRVRVRVDYRFATTVLGEQCLHYPRT